MTGNLTGRVIKIFWKKARNCEFVPSTFDSSLVVISGINSETVFKASLRFATCFCFVSFERFDPYGKTMKVVSLAKLIWKRKKDFFWKFLNLRSFDYTAKELLYWGRWRVRGETARKSILSRALVASWVKESHVSSLRGVSPLGDDFSRPTPGVHTSLSLDTK